MSRRCSTVLVLFFPLLSLQAAPCPSGSPRARVFFANGFFTPTEQDARDAAELAIKHLKVERPTAFNYDCLTWDVSYNDSEWITAQLLEAVIQRQGVEAVSRFWRWLSGSALPESWFAELCKVTADIVNGAAYIVDADLRKHVTRYTDSISDGNKVIVVAHSQGNFYANQAYSVLFGNQPEPPLSVIGVATPSAYVAPGNGPHTTLNQDFIWLLPFVPPPLGPTTPHPDCARWNSLPIVDVLVNRVICHYFERSYLEGSNSRGRIMDHIVAALPTTGTVAVTATLDGNNWPGSGTGAVNYIIACPPRSITGTVVPGSTTGVPVGQCVFTYNSGGPPNTAFRGISPCAIPSATPTTCIQTLTRGQTLTFSLRFANSPPNQVPSAGFVMTSGSQAATNGQTLTLTVPTGGSTSVFFDGSSPRSSDSDGTVTGWQWTINGTQAATGATFSRVFSVGSYSIALIVTGDQGARSVAATGTVVVTGSVPPPGLPMFTVQDLGLLPEATGTVVGYVSDLNDFGQIVGSYGVPARLRSVGFLWSPSGGLANLWPPAQSAGGINGGGQVIGQASDDELTCVYPYLYSGGVFKNLRLLFPESWQNDSSQGCNGAGASAINDAGHVAGSADKLGLWLYDGTSVTVLAECTGRCYYITPVSLNRVGEIVGYRQDFLDAGPPGTARVFRYRGGVLQDIGTFMNKHTFATAANSHGQIVGRSRIVGGSQDGGGWLWTNETMFAAIPLTLPSDINDVGQVVGSVESGAAMWRADIGIVDLNGRIPVNSGWVLDDASAINARGQSAGVGRLNGDRRLFLLTPQ